MYEISNLRILSKKVLLKKEIHLNPHEQIGYLNLY